VFTASEEGLMNKSALKKFERKLIEKKNEILSMIEKEMLDELEDQESENVIGDIVDTANSAFESLLSGTLSENEQKKLREINEALKRIEEGVYGKCVVCGKNIEEKRLTAIPEAKKCIECKMLEEKRKIRTL
jgi:RNA polymerase-binding protein DksA